MTEVSKALRKMSVVCAAIENSSSEPHLTSASLSDEVNSGVAESSDASFEIDVEIPFVEGEDLEPEKTISIKDVQLDDSGTLHIECLAQISSKEDEQSSTARTNSVNQIAGSTEEGTEIGDNETASQQSDTEKQDGQAQGSSPETTTEPRAGSKGSDKKTRGDAADLPPYRDPERLQEVYESQSSFSEMTDALGVDVTPQTVRRYMIKHGIHDPSSNTASSSINALLNADPDSVPIPNKKRDQREEAE